MLQPVLVLRTNDLDHFCREIALLRKLIEELACRLHRLGARFQLLSSVDFALSPSRMRKPEPADDPREQETLPDKGHEDHGKGQKQDQIARRKRRSARRQEGNGKRRRERDNAAHPGEGQHERPLPWRRRIPSSDGWHEPSRQIGRNTHEPGDLRAVITKAERELRQRIVAVR
jgi:hypothetical protein